MTILKKAAVSLAAAGLIAAPVSAQAADRAASSIDAANELEGGSVVIALLAAAAVIAGIVIAADGGDDAPTSP